jgi:hypothetical protein
MRSKGPYTPWEYLVVGIIIVVIPVAAGCFAHEVIAEQFDGGQTADVAATILALLLFAWLNVQQEPLTRIVHRLFFTKW